MRHQYYHGSGTRFAKEYESRPGPLPTGMDVYEELLRLRKLGQKCAIATIVQVRGSIPS